MRFAGRQPRNRPEDAARRLSRLCGAAVIRAGLGLRTCIVPRCCDPRLQTTLDRLLRLVSRSPFGNARGRDFADMTDTKYVLRFIFDCCSGTYLWSGTTAEMAASRASSNALLVELRRELGSEFPIQDERHD